MHNVIIYSSPLCPYCAMAKLFFNENNIQYTDKNVSGDTAAVGEMIEKSGQLGVPVIQIDDNILIGFDKSAVGKLLGIQEN